MSRTYIDIEKGRFNSDLVKNYKMPLFLQKHFDRFNFETGYFRNIKNKLKEKQADKEMFNEMNYENTI